MSQNFELHSFLSNNSNENNIQVYDEIKQDTQYDNIETTFTTSNTPNPLSEYDFFIKQDVKTINKMKKNKTKKEKNKIISSNLTDVINSEIAVSSLVQENVLFYVHNLSEQHNRYLESRPRRTRKTFYFLDSEYGWSRKTQPVNLSPTFPGVLENITPDLASRTVDYVGPCLFQDIIDQNVTIVEEHNTKFLDLTLKDLKFKHHHNFSLEKLLVIKLVEEYYEYEYVQRTIKEILNKIKVKRETKENLKEDLIKVNSNINYDVRFDPVLRKYTKEMLEFKDKYSEAIRHKAEIIHKITTLWSDIELVRGKHERIETPYILKVFKKVLNDKDYEEEWNAIFFVEFRDKLDKIEFEYVDQYMKYKEVKAQSKPSCKKYSKPKLYIDNTAIKKEVENFVNCIVTKEQFTLTLEHNKTILNKNIRITTNFHFEVYIDDVFVCESEYYTSDEMFCTEFTEYFSVQILPKNNNLKIFLIENDTKVSNNEINLLQIRKNIDSADFCVMKFIYNNTTKPNINFVGSGFNIKDIAAANQIRLKSTSFFEGHLNTCCEVNINIGWSNITEQNRTEAIKASMGIGRKIKRLLHGIDQPELHTLIGIISEIYEKDINDANMIETLKNLSKMKTKHDETFRMDDNNPDLVRLKLLHLRNTGQFNNIKDKTVPLYASQISTEQLDCLQRTKEKEFEKNFLNVREIEMDPIELQRFIGAKYIQTLNKNMLTNLNEYLLKKTHKDVVRDFNLSLRGLFSNRSNLVTLATIPKSTKQQLLKENLSKDREVQVTVHRAFNLLNRSSTVLEEDQQLDDEYIAGFKVRPLRPLVRVTYKGASAQTVTAMGCHPTWNHTLKLNTKLAPLSTLHINVFDEYKTNLGESHSEDEHSNKTVHFRYYYKWLGTLQVPLHTVLSLGSLRGTFKLNTPPLLFGYETLQTEEPTSLIPEIYQLMKKDAAFITLQVTTSLSDLGGLHAYNQPLPTSIEDDYLIKYLNNFVTEYTNEFPTRNISLTFIDSAGRNKCVTHFLQPIPLPERDLLPKNPRGESAVSKSSVLSRSSSSSGKRKEKDLERVNQDERESVYSVHDIDDLTKMINACTRYVSLIPCYEETESHAVTLLGLELLKILHGSPLDHTILLASYFIYLGVKCWVAIGLGLPRGSSSYVLIKYDLASRRVVLENDQLFRSKGLLNKSDSYTWYVCDASSGEKCELRDVGCPLKTVEYVFDNENIWVNMQASQDCESISFDFSRSSDWKPVFNKAIFLMKQLIVKDLSLYSLPPNVEELRLALEAKVKGKVQKWRPHTKTIWNRYCSGLLRDMLPQWEFWAFNQTGQKPGLSQKLKQLMVTYKIFGFPLNMPYVNTKAVTSTVKATGIHATDDPNVEFALGLEVFSYPNNVISVWVFLTSISRI